VKAAFAVGVNPFVFELCAWISRVAARAVLHNHPTTSVTLVAIPMILAKLFGRFVIAGIRDSTTATVTSLILGAVEVAFVLSARARDRLLYRLLCGRFLKAGEDWSEVMRSSRNKTLRVAIFEAETTCELAFIWSAAVVVLWYDVSTGGRALVPTAVLLSAARQHAIELAVDLVCVLVLTVLQARRPCARRRTTPCARRLADLARRESPRLESPCSTCFTVQGENFFRT